MTLPDYDAGWDSNRRPKPDALVEWLEDAIAGEPEAEAVIEAVQKARRKERAFDWLDERMNDEGRKLHDVGGEKGGATWNGSVRFDTGHGSLLAAIEYEMERKR